MLSKSQLNFVRSLHLKKFRKEHGLFIAEGIKSITEFIDSDYAIETIFYTANLSQNAGQIAAKIKKIPVSEQEMAKLSAVKTPQGILATVHVPEIVPIDTVDLKGRLALVLDNIQDPGNLGTIIRTADWFGIKHIICSEETVEAYNPKVVQATMGSLAHVRMYYIDIVNWLQRTTLPKYAALLHGKSIYEVSFAMEGLIIMGNEGNGLRAAIISPDVQAITIPRHGKAESLNVAQATAIICAEISRQAINL